MTRLSTAFLAATFLAPASRARTAVDEPLGLVPLAGADAPAEAAAAADDGPRGPGWFDSSWDLRQGLEVREGLPGDAQLHEWIEVCLREGTAVGGNRAVEVRTH